MKSFDKNLLLFVGDIHGDVRYLYDKCSHIEDALVIQVGDAGFGFSHYLKESQTLKTFNELCKDKNLDLVFVRGNHDSKNRFIKFANELKLSNIHFPIDYEVIKFNKQQIQLIGGAVSLDRSQRQEGINYWFNETVDCDLSRCQNVDILVTHTAPTFCHPVGFNEFVFQWAQRDKFLLNDLKNEREQLNDILRACNPKLHVYGHFHQSHVEAIDDCTHKLLDINEVWEHKPYSTTE